MKNIANRRVKPFQLAPLDYSKSFLFQSLIAETFSFSNEAALFVFCLSFSTIRDFYRTEQNRRGKYIHEMKRLTIISENDNNHLLSWLLLHPTTSFQLSNSYHIISFHLILFYFISSSCRLLMMSQVVMITEPMRDNKQMNKQTTNNTRFFYLTRASHNIEMFVVVVVVNMRTDDHEHDDSLVRVVKSLRCRFGDKLKVLVHHHVKHDAIIIIKCAIIQPLVNSFY